MPTKKRRINVTLSKDAAFFVQKLAVRDDMPIATKIAQMIEIAMEMEEDLYFSKIANERASLSKGTMSSKEFWAKVNA